MIEYGMPSGSVMAPLAPLMCDLTLRGIAVARLLTNLQSPKLKIVAVHPGAVFAFRNAPRISKIKSTSEVNEWNELETWFQNNKMNKIKCPTETDCQSHFFDACAAALAAWDWKTRKQKWKCSTEPPFHPFDFSC